MSRTAIAGVLCVLACAAAIPAPARATDGTSNYEPSPVNSEISKPLPEVFRIRSAKYDGRVLTLDVEVPGPGKLFLRIPTSCRTGEPAECHQKTLVVRKAARKGHLIIRWTMSVRVDSYGRLNVAARMELQNRQIVSFQKPKVHMIAR